VVPQTATEVVSKEAGSAPIDFTNRPDLITAGVLNIRPMFKQSVFSGEKFPVCDLEKPADTEQALGKCMLTPTFYDAGYNEVKTADKPGRYGAIIHVGTASGQKFNRFATLYRAPEELLGRILRPEFTDIKLPPELGIDPTVVSSHLKSVGDLFGYEFRTSAGMNRGPEAAILLAWLSETKADNAPDLQRTGPSAADQKWWYGLKKKTGNLRTDYFVHLPPDYDKDPQKKWPVILFLHGSGERGYDLKILARQPLVQDIDKRKDFPFILVAPQVSPGDWWSIPELDDLLDGLPSKYRIDTGRIYLTGLSMGGFATWSYLAAEPERFAAAVPICGGGDPEDAARFKDVPIWVFHGGKDDAVPIQRSQEMVDALKKLGSNVKFTVFPDVDHFSWIPAYKSPELYQWLLQQRKK
jgi:predicted esterase